MKKLVILFILFCAFLVLLNNNLTTQSKTQQYPEQQPAQNIKPDDFRNIWWLKAAYYDSLEKGVTPYYASSNYLGIVTLYFSKDTVSGSINFHEGLLAKYVQKSDSELTVFSISEDERLFFSAKIISNNQDTILQISDNFFSHSPLDKEQFIKYPQKYSFIPPPDGLVNDIFFAGKYQSLISNNKEIEFTIDGKITGLNNYTNYRVGIGFIGPPSFDCIMFQKFDGIRNRLMYDYNNDLYHWKFNDDTLELYPVITTYSNPDSLGPLKWKLLRVSR